MSDLEELIEMRKEAIEKAIKYYNTIKEKLKENAKEFYKNYINPELERQAKTNINSAGMVYLMNGRYILSDLTINRNSPVKKWLSSIINDNIPLITICELLNIAEDPIIAIDISEKAEDDRNYLYFKISNIKEIVEQDGLSLEKDESNNIYQVTANAPKLELPEYKETTTRSEELDKIREEANQIYLEQLELERNIIEKQLLENSIDYYTNVLYSNLKSNVENDYDLKVGSYTVKESGIIINHDDDITESTFEALAKNFKILKADGIMKYIVIDSNPIIYCQREDDSWIVRLNYLKELAEKDGLSFSADSIYEGQLNYSLTKQNLQKLEIPKHKVLTLED